MLDRSERTYFTITLFDKEGEKFELNPEDLNILKDELRSECSFDGEASEGHELELILSEPMHLERIEFRDTWGFENGTYIYAKNTWLMGIGKLGSGQFQLLGDAEDDILYDGDFNDSVFQKFQFGDKIVSSE